MSDNRILLNSAFRGNLLAIQNTERLIDRTSLRLATGLKVNSALDHPQNFFTARALNYRAADLSRLLHGIAQSRRAVEEAITGVEGIERLLTLAQSEAQTSLEKLRAEGEPAASTPAPVTPLSTQILAANPVGYWRLNEGGGAAVNHGTIGAAVNGAYQGGPTFNAGSLYDSDDTSVSFNGTNQSLSIPNHAQINLTNHALRTVEVTFNANSTAGRQVIYEEGGTTNAFSIYIFNGSLYINGRDAGAWGPTNLSVPIVAGQTYHAAFTFDFPGGVFRAYVDGVEIGNAPVTAIFPSHSGAIGIGRMSNGSWFHDGAQSGNNFYFNGRVSDVAIYNSVLAAPTLQSHAQAVIGAGYQPGQNERFNTILDQIDLLARDAHYRGINLLLNDDLVTYFNETNSHRLETASVDFSVRGLGIRRTDFNKIEGVEGILESLRTTLKTVRNFGRQLATHFSILTVRENFTNDTIVILEAGAADLTVADQNREGANLLAMQTRQQLATTSLSLAAQSQQSVINLFA